MNYSLGHLAQIHNLTTHGCCFLSYQPATPSRPPVVVDWASGVAPKPDPRTISKHVQRMVDVSVSILFQVAASTHPRKETVT